MEQFIPTCCKTQKLCKKAVEYYPHALECILDCQEIREKTVDTYPSRLMHVSYCNKTQKMSEKAVRLYP